MNEPYPDPEFSGSSTVVMDNLTLLASVCETAERAAIPGPSSISIPSSSSPDVSPFGVTALSLFPYCGFPDLHLHTLLNWLYR